LETGGKKINFKSDEPVNCEAPGLNDLG